jgi:uncharacterized DUF497 family protein
VNHIGEHGVSPADAEYVVTHASPPYPAKIEDEKYVVRGRDSVGRYLQVIYVFSPANVVFVIHARPLTEHEKRRLRRRRR